MTTSVGGTQDAGLDFPWLRRIRVEISGLRNGGSREYESNGTLRNLRIAATIQKSIGLSEPAQIQITNLSADTRANLQRQKTKIRVSAGWDQGNRAGMCECFYGDLQNSMTSKTKDGKDLVTTIFALSGIDALAKESEYKTYKGESVVAVVKELARKLENVSVDDKDIQGIEGRIPDDGWSAVGTVRQSLDSLGRQYGFAWSIIDNRFMACSDRHEFGRITQVRSPYLIDINPIFNTPLEYETGITWRCTFEPDLLPFNGVNIQSSISDMAKEYSGVYRVHKVVHSLDCYASNSFQTSGMAFILSKAD